MVPAALAVAVLALWAGVAPAAAHDGAATITVDQAHPSPGSVHYIVEVVWTDDGHAAVGATVTATPTSPSGEAGTPVEMAPNSSEEDGLYQGAVDLPEDGDWTVTFSSLEPDGTLEHTETVAAPAAEEPDDSAGAEEDTDDAAEEDADDEAAAPEEEPEPEVAQSNPDADLSVEAGEESGDDGDDGPSVGLLLLAFAVLGAVVAGAFWFMMKRKEAEDDSTDAAAGSEDTTTGTSVAPGDADAESNASE
jgi:hypothetical protein